MVCGVAEGAASAFQAGPGSPVGWGQQLVLAFCAVFAAKLANAEVFLRGGGRGGSDTHGNAAGDVVAFGTSGQTAGC